MMKFLKTFEGYHNGKRYYIPTYKECVEIVESNNEMCFYETKYVVDGYNVSTFSYRLAKHENFMNPVPNKDMKATELKGITFVFNKDGSVFNHYLMLDKFWQLDQYNHCSYKVYKNKKIKSIYNKEDGSLLTFIKLPNGKNVAKTKYGFKSEHSEIANNLYKRDESIKKIIDYCLDNDIAPMFELVGNRNVIVLKYEETQLILLRLRNNNTGAYIDLDDFQKDTGLLDGLRVCAKEDIKTLDELIKKSKNEIDKEGWVATFDDDTLLKVKTDWYTKQDKTSKSLLLKENHLIELILNEKIDDIISKLNKKTDADIFENIEYITEIIGKYINNGLNVVKKSKEYHKTLNGSLIEIRKQMYIKFKNSKYFNLIMSSYRSNKDPYDILKDFILTKTSSLESAREFLKKNEMK